MASKKLAELLRKAEAEMTMLYEIGNALRTTLDFEETLYIILTGITAHVGLGFNRAAIFLIDAKHHILQGWMGLGPSSVEEAQRIWDEIQKKQLTLNDLIANHRQSNTLKHSSFHQTVRSLRIPLTERAGGFIARALLTETPIEIVTPEDQAQAKEDPVLRVLGSTSCVLVPLKARGGEGLGVIFADNRITQKPISREMFRLLALLTAHAALAIENAQLYQRALEQADLDPLTQLWNRGAFQRTLMDELARVQRDRSMLSLLLADIDHFKAYNDRYGHLAGDRLLASVAKLLKESARSGDYVARLGGEEFAFILPHTSKFNAFKLAERLRLSVHLANLPVTLSVGVATFPQDATACEELLASADRALYQAKRDGRNRVAVA